MGMFVGNDPVVVSKLNVSFATGALVGKGIAVNFPNLTVGPAGAGGNIFKYAEIPNPKRIFPSVKKTIKKIM